MDKNSLLEHGLTGLLELFHQQGYKQAQSNHTLFFRHKDGQITILIIYVDNIILIGDDQEEMKKLKEILAK